MLNFGRGRKQRKNAFFTDKQPGFWRASPPHGGMPRREPMLAAEGRPRVRKPVAPGKGRHGPGAANAPLTGGGPALHPGTAVSRWLRRAQIAPQGPSPSAAAGGADALAHAQRRPLSVSGANWPSSGGLARRLCIQHGAERGTAAGTTAAGSRCPCPCYRSSAMNAENFGSSERLVTAAYVRQGAQGRRAHELRLRALLEQVTGPPRRACSGGGGAELPAGPAWDPASEPAPPALRPALARPGGPRGAPPVLPRQLPPRSSGRLHLRCCWWGARPGWGGSEQPGWLCRTGRAFMEPRNERPSSGQKGIVVCLLRKAQQTVKEVFHSNKILTYCYMR